MADFPAQVQDYNRVTISTASPESLGVEVTATSNALTSGQTWPAANRAIFVPIVVHSAFTVAQLFCANGGAVSGNVDVGLYDTGGNRIVSSGSTAHAGTGTLQFFNVTDTPISAGVYYMAMVLDSTSGAIAGCVPAIGITQAFGVLSMASAFPLPTTATFATVANTLVPQLGLTSRAF